MNKEVFIMVQFFLEQGQKWKGGIANWIMEVRLYPVFLFLSVFFFTFSVTLSLSIFLASHLFESLLDTMFW